MNDSNREEGLVGRLKRFVPRECHTGSDEIIRAWIGQALRRMLQSQGARAFAPFNGYFETPRDRVESFAVLVKNEFAGVEIDGIDAEEFLALGVRKALFAFLSSQGRRMHDDRRLAPEVFELLEILMLVDAESGFNWATQVVKDEGGLADLLSQNNTPVPIELFLMLSYRPGAIGPWAREFQNTLLSWCLEHSEIPGAIDVGNELVEGVMQNASLVTGQEADGPISPPDRKKAAQRQIEIIDAMIQNVDDLGSSFLERYVAASASDTQAVLEDTEEGRAHIKDTVERLEDFQSMMEPQAAEHLKREYSAATANATSLHDPWGDGSILQRIIPNSEKRRAAP